MHAGADTATKAEWQLEIYEARIRSLNETLRAELVGVGEEDGVVYDPTEIN